MYDGNVYEREAVYLGIIESVDENGYCVMEQKNKFAVGEQLEILHPHATAQNVTVLDMLDEEGNHIESCPHAKQRIKVLFSKEPVPYDLLRRPE